MMDPPSSFPYQVTYRYFSEYTRLHSPHVFNDKVALQDEWNKYKLERLRSAYWKFFEEWKSKPWFQERYSLEDEWKVPREETRKKGRGTERFLEGLERGEWDGLSLDYEPKKEEDVQMDDAKKDAHDSQVGAQVTEKTSEDQNQETDAKMTAVEGDPPIEGQTEMEADGEGEEEKKEEEDENNEAPHIPSAGPNDELVLVPGSANTLFIKSISPDLSRKDLEDLCKDLEGFEYLALSEPHPGKRFHRVGWVRFKEGTDMTVPLQKLCEAKVNDFTLHMVLGDKPTYQKLRFTPGSLNDLARLEKDLEAVKKWVGLFESEEGEDRRGSERIEGFVREWREKMDKEAAERGEEVDEETAKVETTKKSLDLYVQYLRTAYNSCYYCVWSADYPEELARRCVKHVRRKKETEEEKKRDEEQNGKPGFRSRKEKTETLYPKNLDEKLALVISRDEIDPKDYGGENLDEELHKLCIPYVKHEDEGKFRCKVKECNKLFKALNFIEKHIANKHPEILGDRLEKLKYFNAYALDPSHVVPPQNPTSDHANTQFASNASMFPPPMMNPMMFPFNFGAMPFYPNPMSMMGGGGGGGRDRDRDRDRDDGRRREKRQRRDDGPPGGSLINRLDRPPPGHTGRDPRAERVKSYHDLDTAPQGDTGEVVLNY
ncbi:hypothetical protein BT69DRAFT_11011 [Atractiella rhizophila]|nr:hypothetical protein BT69DRAFT_11011 [Atractiella rhizophila]